MNPRNWPDPPPALPPKDRLVESPCDCCNGIVINTVTYNPTMPPGVVYRAVNGIPAALHGMKINFTRLAAEIPRAEWSEFFKRHGMTMTNLPEGQR